jgi:hypothetical protein
MDALLIAPELYYDDAAIYLGLKTVHNRMIAADALASLRTIYDLMWDVALRIEDGDISAALRRVDLVRKELMKALAEGASDEEIQRLMDELREAVERYVAALRAAGLDEMAGDLGGGGQSFDLDDFLEAIEEASRLGSRDAAREMLSGLTDMLRNLRMGQGQGSGDGEGEDGRSEEEREIAEALEDLSDMLGEQRDLMDDTFRQRNEGGQGQDQGRGQTRDPFTEDPMQRLEELLNRQLGRRGMGESGPQQARPGQDGAPGQQGQQGQQDKEGQGQQGEGEQGRDAQGQAGEEGGAGAGGEGPAELAQRQDELRARLNELLRRLEEKEAGEGSALGRAEDSMGEAGRALREGDDSAALGEQEEAIATLREGAAALAQELLDRMAERTGRQPGEEGMAAGQDPLGRSGSTGPSFGEGVEVPDKGDLERAREILEELRRRAGERNRPAHELDYLDRLLRQF